MRKSWRVRKRWLGRSRFAVAPGTEVVAFGDVHGHPAILEALVEAAAALPRRAADRELVLLGDLIDRGMGSLAVLDAAPRAGERVGASRQIDLWGNHEQLASMAIGPDAGAAEARCWLRNGGSSLAAELATERPELREDSTGKTFVPALRERLGPWLSRLVGHHRSGDVLFVHAGVHPNRELAGFLGLPVPERLTDFDEDDHWAWIREPFLHHADGHHGCLVVHGHSIIGRDDLAAGDAERLAMGRVNLDPGSYLNGRGRLARLVGDEVEVVEVQT